MEPSTRTPEGEPNRCPVCGHAVQIEPSRPPGDAPCPFCGTLLWFPGVRDVSSGKPRVAVVVTAWQYGLETLSRGDAPMALAVLQNVIAHRPRDASRRRALREIERSIRRERKADGLPASEAFAITSEIRQAKNKRAGKLIEWDTIDRAAERGLAIDPWNVELNLELGDACRARGYREAALFAYNCALEVAPDRADIKDRIAES